MILATAAERQALLLRTRTIAVVGVSPRPTRPSYRIFQYLRTLPQYETMPVNPRAEAIDGLAAYGSLDEYLRACGAPGLVDVFRAPGEAAATARAAVAAGAKAIWFQLGVATDEAVRVADDAGLAVVADACIKVELLAMHFEHSRRSPSG